MGSTSGVKPPASRLAREDARPILVTGLVVGWMLLAGFGALRALVHVAGVAAPSAAGGSELLAARATLERGLALPLLAVAALAAAGAVALLRRRTFARALLLAAGLLALGLSVFHASRVVDIAVSPAAGLTDSEPDARNAVALVRSAVWLGLALQSIPLLVALGLLRHPIVRRWVQDPQAPPGAGARPDALLVVAGVAVLVAAGSFLFSKTRARTPAAPAPTAAASASAPETFVWNGQPITFVPPAGAWTRERHAEGGRKGVSFTRSAAPPSRIVVADAALEPPPNTVEEALPRLRLTPEQFRSADSALVGEPAAAAVAGLPAFQTDYTLRERSMQHRGREFLVVAGRHAFVLSFLGRETDLPVLENLVASVHFPDSGAPLGGVRTIDDKAARAETRGAVLKLRVGDQRLAVRLPPAWEHVDYGQRQEFRNGEQAIALVDGGELPAGVTQAAIDNDTHIDRALRLFDHDARRWEVGAKRRIRAGAREALAVDTWDPLTHVVHKRTVLIVNERRLLVAGTVRGTFEATRGPLDALVSSLKFPD